MSVGFSVRKATASDAAQLLHLMKGLAHFEGYAERFEVTEQELLVRGLGPNSLQQFTALVAESQLGELWGYAVVYEVPFTYDLKPTLVLKELFVSERCRGGAVGSALMARVVAHATARGCPRLKWDVLPGNERAKSFYRRLGGRLNEDWEAWALLIGS